MCCGSSLAACGYGLHTYGKTCVRYFLVDFGDSGERGDCFWFVSKWENLDYHNDFEEILRVIDRELCLNLFKDDKKPVIQSSTRLIFLQMMT